MGQKETVVTVISKISERPVNLDAALVVIYGLDLGRKYDLAREETLIGRSSKADIQIDQEAVSRNHARITNTTKGVRIEDLGSTNGTFVNDDVASSARSLHNGDLVKIGRTIFKFIAGGNIEAAYHDEIYRLTTMDGLTQIYNRRYFDEQLDRELSRSRRYERVLSLVMFDLDHFKDVNDTYGHLAGDSVLKQLASTVRTRIRREDVFARYGGEEFGLLLPEINLGGARQLAEKVRKLVERQRFEFDKQVIPVTLSVGVARQYCGQLGKKANCQSLVSLTLARREVPLPVALRLFLPDTWTGDPDRCARAGVPETEVVPRTKGEIALAELDRLGSAGVRFGTVLADAGYGASAVFRQGLSERGLLWAVGIARNQKVYGAVVQLTVPAGRRRRAVPSEEPREAEAVLAAQPWRRVTWRQGTRGALAARFAAIRVRVGDGPAWGNNRHLPGDEAWLVGEWRSSGERKYYLSNLGPRTSLRGLAAAIKARWVCEQAHQQLKQELGLGHFEGRSWTGLHRHALMTCIAFAYLQHLRLAQHRRASRGKNAAHRSGTAAAPEPACRATGHHRTAVCSPRITRAMSTLQTSVPAPHQT